MSAKPACVYVCHIGLFFKIWRAIYFNVYLGLILKFSVFWFFDLNFLIFETDKYFVRFISQRIQKIIKV